MLLLLCYSWIFRKHYRVALALMWGKKGVCVQPWRKAFWRENPATWRYTHKKGKTWSTVKFGAADGKKVNKQEGFVRTWPCVRMTKGEYSRRKETSCNHMARVQMDGVFLIWILDAGWPQGWKTWGHCMKNGQNADWKVSTFLILFVNFHTTETQGNTWQMLQS